MYAGYEGHPVSSLYVGRGKNVDEKQEEQVDDFDRLQVTNLEK